MQPTVYVDILFLTNFLTDFFLLYMTKTLGKNNSPTWRLVCGACVGSVYSVLMFFPDLSFFYSKIAKIIVSIAIVYISFSIKSKREFISLFVMFFLSGFALAGITFALFYYTDAASRIGAVMSNGIIYVNINPLYLISGALVCYAVLFVGEKIYIKRADIHINIHIIKVSYKEKTVCIKALLDTANAISDPITNTPVIVCQIKALKPLFKNENYYDTLLQACKNDSDKLKMELVCDTPFRLVLYRAFGSSGDVMLAFSPTLLEIDNITYKEGVLIGICSDDLSRYSNYDALLHPRIMAKLNNFVEVI